MKSLLLPRKFKLLFPICGILGLLLRRLMIAAGTDDKGLLVSGHPAWIGLLILTAVTAAALLLCVGRVRGSGAYRISFPHSFPAAAGCILAAVSAAVCAFDYWRAGEAFRYAFNPMASAARVLGGVVLTLVPAVFLLMALFRLWGRKPNYLLHCLICVFFSIQSLTLYQSWSFDPQIRHYCFQLFARIALTITAYQLAMFDVGRGSHRRLWLWGLTAVYLCCVSLDGGLFYIAGAVWAFTNLSRPRRKRLRRQPEPMPTEEVYYPD